jgi:hypothetical protein
MWADYLFFKKPAQSKQSPKGENSPNRVTLHAIVSYGNTTDLCTVSENPGKMGHSKGSVKRDLWWPVSRETDSETMI